MPCGLGNGGRRRWREGGAQVAERRAEPAEVEFDETLVPALATWIFLVLTLF
jgi:hypothetical protein